jgi:hypothetical protein
VSLFSVFPALSSNAPTLSSGSCCEANSSPVGAILVIFCRDPFVDIVSEYKIGRNQIMNSNGDYELGRVLFRLLKAAVTFGGMKASNIDLKCHESWSFTLPFIP